MLVTTHQRDIMTHLRIAPTGPLRIGVVLGDRLWLDTPGDVVRVRAADLRSVTQKAAALREERPNVHALVDIDVMIARDAHSARAAMAAAPPTDGTTLLYVGTPVGLAGLIADIHALGIADGAVLIPLTRDGVTDLIRDEVLPEVRTMVSLHTETTACRTA
jgi:hypothetical protein